MHYHVVYRGCAGLTRYATETEAQQAATEMGAWVGDCGGTPEQVGVISCDENCYCQDNK